MRMSTRTAAAVGRPRLRNRLPEHLAASRLSSEDVAARVEQLTGNRPDRRTLRRYLSGEPILDATAITLAAICQALGVTLDMAVELMAEDPLEVQLAAAGRRLLTPEVGNRPSGWGRPDPAWGDLVAPFIEERRGRY